jgi:hypothetical protein
MKRFPDSLLADVQKRFAATPELALTHGNKAWRQHGERKAYAWILAIYGLPSGIVAYDKGLTRDLPGVELVWSEGKPSKEAFAILVDNIHECLQIAHGLDPSNGYAQVERKSSDKNEAYGFYDTLATIADQHNLWALADKVRGRKRAEQGPGDIEVHKTTRQQDGECSFCPSRDAVVYEIGSTSRAIKVRCCTRCLKSIAQHAKRIR